MHISYTPDAQPIEVGDSLKWQPVIRRTRISKRAVEGLWPREMDEYFDTKVQAICRAVQYIKKTYENAE